MENLKNKKCVPCEGGVPALTKTEAEKLLTQIPQWQLNSTATEITRTFDFKNFHQVMEFANAVASIANKENHHPDLELSYSHAKVRYSTHAIKGLSENDFICAAKIDELIK